MERPDQTPVAGQRHTCRNCNETKPVTPGAWAFRPGGVPLQICLVCQTLRKAEGKAQAAASAEGKPQTPKEIRGEAKLDIAKALKSGAAIANGYVDMVMARVLQYAADPEHRLHGWALQFLAERVMPRKLYEDLGSQAAGSGLGDKRPQFILQVLPAQQPEQPAGRIIDVTPRPEVTILPSPESKE